MTSFVRQNSFHCG